MVPARLLFGVSIAIMGATAANAQSDAGGAAGNWDRVVQCAAIDGTAERHQCIDAVLRQAGVLTPEREIAEQRESFGEPPRNEERAAPAPHAVQGMPAQAAQRTARPSPAPPPEEITGLTTTVADALIGGDRLLVVATAEGAIWKQIGGDPFRRTPATGDGFSVEEGALGSYRCKIGSDVYRCRRVD